MPKQLRTYIHQPFRYPHKSINQNKIDRLRSRPIIAEGYPKNLTLLVNMTGRFECKVLTDLEPFITWVKHDINGRNDSNITSSETVIRTSIDEIRNHSIPGYVVCKVQTTLSFYVGHTVQRAGGGLDTKAKDLLPILSLNYFNFFFFNALGCGNSNL